MSKSRITKASKKRLIVFGSFSLIIIGYFLFSLSFYIYSLYDLKRSETNLENHLRKLKRDEKILRQEIEKLKDDEYIARYARENYAYSKDGEYILKLDDSKEKEEKENKFEFNIDYNYILYGGAVIILLMLFYTIKKKK